MVYIMAAKINPHEVGRNETPHYGGKERALCGRRSCDGSGIYDGKQAEAETDAAILARNIQKLRRIKLWRKTKWAECRKDAAVVGGYNEVN